MIDMKNLEEWFRPQVAKRLQGRIRLAAFNAGKQERVFLSEKIEKLLKDVHLCQT